MRKDWGDRERYFLASIEECVAELDRCVRPNGIGRGRVVLGEEKDWNDGGSDELD